MRYEAHLERSERLPTDATKGLRPGAKKAACPSQLRSKKGQASPEAALPLQAYLGIALRHSDAHRDVELTRELVAKHFEFASLASQKPSNVTMA